MTKKLFGLITGFSLLLISGCGPEGPAPARYQVTFVSTWSASTHPTNVPSNPHFSPLVGATHSEDFEMWASGTLASDGLEEVAELGGTDTIQGEIEEAIDLGTARGFLLGSAIASSPGQSEALVFEVHESHPELSLISMVAPSPDWFVGVSGLSLREDSEWIDRIEVDLRVYDSGTDSGTTFTAADSDTNPAQAVGLLTSAASDTDFRSGEPTVGYFKIVRID